MTSLTLSKYTGATAEVRFPILEHDSRLYSFTRRAGLSAWDVKNGWQPFSPVLSWSENHQYWYNTDLSALGTWQGRLVAGGRFERVGEVEAQSIAMRDGETWIPLGTGLDFECPPGDDDCFIYYLWASYFCRVRAMADLNGDLIVAGSFNRAGGKKCLNIARWDGAEWHALGAGLNDVVMDLAVVGRTSTPCGYFSDAGPDERPSTSSPAGMATGGRPWTAVSTPPLSVCRCTTTTSSWAASSDTRAISPPVIWRPGTAPAGRRWEAGSTAR